MKNASLQVVIELNPDHVTIGILRSNISSSSSEYKKEGRSPPAWPSFSPQALEV